MFMGKEQSSAVLSQRLQNLSGAGDDMVAYLN